MKSGLLAIGFLFYFLFFLASLPSPATAQNTEFRGWFADAWGANFWTASQSSQFVADARAGHFNALVPQVRRRGDALYTSHYEPKCVDVSASYDPLGDLVAKAHNTNAGPYLEVHAWIVTYHVWKTSATYPMPPQPTHPVNLHPDWLLKDVNGATLIGGQYSFDPGHPEVQRHTFNVCMDIITNYNVDGLNFDYIRYASTSEGYNDVTVARFNRLFQRTGVPATGDAAWKQFRRDQVTALLRKVYLNAIAVRPNVKISCDTITWYPGPANDSDWYNTSGAYTGVLQDWRGWMQEGIMDLNLPMAYFNQAGAYTRDWTNWCNFTRDRQFNRHAAINAGTYLNTCANAITQLRYTRMASPAGNSAAGMCVYDYGTPATDVSRATFINALVAPSAYDTVTPPIYTNVVGVTPMPWKTALTKGHLMGYVYGGSTTNPLDGAVVTLTGPAGRLQTNDATGFYGFVDLAPGTYAVAASFPGYFSGSTNVTISAGAVSAEDVILAWNGAPTILVPPRSQSVTEGSNAVFSVVAAGDPELGYQWFFQETNRLGSTSSNLVLTAVAASNAGPYTVVVTNSLGAATSAPATLNVLLPPPPGRLSPRWSLAPGSRPWLTVNSLANERGMAYNPVSRRVLVVSRTNPNVYALDSDTGADLHQLSVSGVTGGYGANYYLLMIGAADDGAVYAGNLSQAPATTPFKLYRWANDNPGTTPTVAFSGDPSPGNSQRWGDTLDVRGSGPNTQVIIGSRAGNSVVIFTTANGTTFTPRAITVADTPTGGFGLGIAFGSGNTFWGKASGMALRQVSFDLAAGAGATLRAHDVPGFPSAVTAIGVSTTLNLLAGVNVSSPNHLRLYDLAPAAPVLLATNLFPADNDNTGTGTGAVDISGDRVYALDSNNGLLALQIALAPVITNAPQDRIVKAGANVTFSVAASSSTPLTYQWSFNGVPLQDATASSYTAIAVLANRSGLYSVLVTNLAGFATASASLTVLPPVSPSLGTVSLLPGGLLEWNSNGDPGTYTLQSATNLAEPAWVDLTNIVSPDGAVRFRDVHTNYAQRFYRAVWGP